MKKCDVVPEETPPGVVVWVDVDEVQTQPNRPHARRTEHMDQILDALVEHEDEDGGHNPNLQCVWGSVKVDMFVSDEAWHFIATCNGNRNETRYNL